jgi:hypothetical protein
MKREFAAMSLGDGAGDGQPKAEPAGPVHSPRHVPAGEGLQHGVLVGVRDAGAVVDDVDLDALRGDRTQADGDARAPLGPVLD